MRFRNSAWVVVLLGCAVACSERDADQSTDAGGADAASLSDARVDALVDAGTVDLGRDMFHPLVDMGPPRPELCDDIDNDFNPATPDGSEDARYHEICIPDPSAPAAACEGWVNSCEGGSWHCKQLYGPTSAPIAIVTGEGLPSGSSIAWNGTNYVVAYAVHPGGSDWRVKALLVSDLGDVVGGPVELGSTLLWAPKLVSNGDETMAVWPTNTGTSVSPRYSVAYARLSASLDVLGSGSVAGPYASILTVAVSHNSHGYIVGWGGQEAASDSHLTTFSAHLDNEGARVGGVFSAGVLPDSSRGIGEFVSVSADEYGYAVAWASMDSDAAYLQLLDNSFVPVVDVIEVPGTDAEGAAVVAEEARVGMSWFQTNQISFMATDRDGASVVTPWSVSDAPGAFIFDPQMISTCATFALTWQQVRFGASTITADGIYIVQLASDARSVEWESNLSCIASEPTDWTARQAMARGNGNEIGIVWNGSGDGLMFVNVLAPCNLLF